jgi:hypothetical protein
MPFDDKTLKRDGSGITPVPQHFNPIADDYEPIYGRNNAGRVEIYGPDGNPISTDDSNKLAVRASEIETILNEIKSKDFATQTTAAAILAKLIAAPSTEAKQDALAALIGEVDADPTANSLLARLKSLEDKIDAITDGTSPAVTQLSGSNVVVYHTKDSAPSTYINIGVEAAYASTTVTPINVSQCKIIYIYIKNNMQKTLTDIYIHQTINYNKTVSGFKQTKVSDIAAGATLKIVLEEEKDTAKTDYQQLYKEYLPGLVIRGWMGSDVTGTINVLVTGGGL